MSKSNLQYELTLDLTLNSYADVAIALRQYLKDYPHLSTRLAVQHVAYQIEQLIKSKE